MRVGKAGDGAGGPLQEVEVAPGVVISSLFCAFVEEGRVAVAADLHLGFEAVAAADGAYFPKRQKPVLVRRLGAILDRYRPELFIIAGDFKHNFSRNLRQEMEEVEEVMDFLTSRVDVAAVRGNHDNYLLGILPGGAALPDNLPAGGCLVSHGHRETAGHECRGGLRILAHEHPSLRLSDPVGARACAPAFLFDDRSRTLVLPALSPLAPGSDVLKGRLLSPVLRRLDRKLFRIFAVTGSGLLDFGPAGLL